MIDNKVLTITALSIIVAFELVSCGNVKDASKDNLAKAIDKKAHQAKECLMYGYPVKFDSDKNDLSIKNPLAGAEDVSLNLALEKVGILRSVDFDYTTRFSLRDPAELPKYKGKEFFITEKGKQYQQHNSICYTGGIGNIEVLKFTEPAENGGVKTTNVTYRYKDENIPEWVQNENVTAELKKYVTRYRRGFPGDGSKVAVIKLTLTNEGWE
jgi:hypothetical protein